MKVLLVYPKFPITFWSFRHVLSIISKKTTEPPLGLITVASMLPVSWEKRLVDLNLKPLKDREIKWADLIFISGMGIQRSSFKETVQRCNELGATVVAGGPMVTEDYHQFDGIDHFILNEAESTLPAFLSDLESGCPQRVYSSNTFPDLTKTPAPDWNLLDMKKYASMDLQYSRGCPFDCEFCSITALFGRRPRLKSTRQFILELESLYNAGWKGPVFIVDDNFIGDKKRLKSELLSEITTWQTNHSYPFAFTTEVSINLSDDETLMDLMSEAGFKSCFVGIESPDDESLGECGKLQNRGRDMVESVKRMQRKGFNVSGGFIVGFDSDTESIFERQIRFIQQSGIVTAMVGLLNAPLGTRLFRRLESENRIIRNMSGDNTDGTLNFVPVMDQDKLMEGYRKLLRTIYSPREYFERIVTFLQEYKLPEYPGGKSWIRDLRAFLKALFRLGLIQNRGKRYFWKLLGHTLINYPRKLGTAVTMAVYGYHFRKVSEAVDQL